MLLAAGYLVALSDNASADPAAAAAGPSAVAPLPVAPMPVVPMPVVPIPVAPIPVAPTGLAPLQPILGVPPLPTTPLGRSLAGAYDAIAVPARGPGVAARDPGIAVRATGLYLQAVQRARAGDVSGALAASSLARAAALAGGTPAALVPSVPFAGTVPFGAAPSPGVPLATAGAALPPDLRSARDAIVRAELAGRASRLGRAREQYRAALDAYLSGDAERAVRDARAATAAVKER